MTNTTKEQEKQETTYKVYIHRNKINNKRYIGITKKKVKQRWNKGEGYKSQRLFYNAIKKYGWNNIQHKILFENLTKEEACKKEQNLIASYKSNYTEYGYNIANGGNTSDAFTDEIKRKISINTKKALQNPLIRQKMKEHRKKQISPMKGKKLSEEHKLKLRHDGMKGKKHTQESKILMRKNIKNKKQVLCIEQNIIYESINEAARQNNIDYRNIHRSCNNNCRAGGFHWEYYNIKNNNNEEEN